MFQKQIRNSQIFAWNRQKKYSNFIACIDQQDPTILQIYSFDLASPSIHTKLIASTQIDQEIEVNCITWTTFGENQNFSLGIILLGLKNGTVQLYDASILIENYAQNSHGYQQGLIKNEQELFNQNLPVNTIEYNEQKPNLIAIGGEEVIIMNIENIENNDQEIDVFLPWDNELNENKHDGSPVISVCWNKTVPHILASSSQNGITVIWNLKSNNPIFSFGEVINGLFKNTQLAWNPEISTQLAISYEDEKSYEIQIWDLRNPNGPVILLENQQSCRINSLNWSQADPSLLLSSSDSQGIQCWNYKLQEIVAEDNLEEENDESSQIVSIQWSSIPSIYAVSLESGKIIIKSLNSINSLSNPPKWIQNPVGNHFNPQQYILNFEETNGSVVQINKIKNLKINPLVEKLKSLSLIFDHKNIQNYCNQKIESYQKGSNLSDFWKILLSLHQKDNRSLIKNLGLDEKNIIKNAEDYSGKTHRKGQEEDQGKSDDKKYTKPQKYKVDLAGFTKITENEAENIFDQMAKKQQDEKLNLNNSSQVNSNNRKIHREDSKEQVLIQETISRNINWDTGIEKIIKENLIVGNIAGAIDCAMKSGRIAEALLIAQSESKELFDQTVNSFFISNTDSFVKNILKNFVKKNLQDVISHYDLDKWKECASLILCSQESEIQKRNFLANLGDRLIEEKSQQQSAILCYLMAQNLEDIVDLYCEDLESDQSGDKSHQLGLILEIVERIIAISQIFGQEQKVQNKKLDLMIYKLTIFAYDQGEILCCYNLLQFFRSKNLQIQLFQDRVYNSFRPILEKSFQKPAQPFIVENITVSKKVLGLNKKKLEPEIKNFDPISTKNKNIIKYPLHNLQNDTFSQTQIEKTTTVNNNNVVQPPPMFNKNQQNQKKDNLDHNQPPYNLPQPETKKNNVKPIFDNPIQQINQPTNQIQPFSQTSQQEQSPQPQTNANTHFNPPQLKKQVPQRVPSAFPTQKQNNNFIPNQNNLAPNNMNNNINNNPIQGNNNSQKIENNPKMNVGPPPFKNPSSIPPFNNQKQNSNNSQNFQQPQENSNNTPPQNNFNNPKQSTVPPFNPNSNRKGNIPPPPIKH